MLRILFMAKKEIFHNHALLSFSCLMLLLLPSSAQQTNKLLPGKLIKDGDELVSANGTFRLGFFYRAYHEHVRYLGISYKDDVANGCKTPVWIANRNNPISDRSGRLTIDKKDGSLKILRDGGNPIFVSPVLGARNTSATLMESGNLVLKEVQPNGSEGPVLWQSFDYPTDTLLPGMKIGINFRTGQKWFLQSWITPWSPAQGSFTLGVDPNARNQLVIRWRGEVYWTSGPWLNGRFGKRSDRVFNNISFVSNEQEAYFNLSIGENSSLASLKLNSDGSFANEGGDFYHPCSPPDPFENCALKLPICGSDISDFHTKTGFMSRDGSTFKESENMTYLDCHIKCLYDCSCVAFAIQHPNNDTGCEIWSRGTHFTESFAGQSRQIYVRFKVPEVRKRWPWRSITIAIVGTLMVTLICSSWYRMRRQYKAEGEQWLMSFIIVVGVALIIPLLCYLSYLLSRKFKAKVKSILNRKKLLRELGDDVPHPTPSGKDKTQEKHQRMNRDLKIFDFQHIAAATDNFSDVNKLGEGGFGAVYKGKLVDGKEIAIKRLSRRSGQGIVEFKNEAKLIAKLQHTNLVRLLGCSLHGEERILVYEYMPNKSLDFFIFDSSRKHLLNWKQRFSIIEGIAQGLIYLHKYSRLRVIHRDLKASNILLDEQMNPKISDFGMAKIFGSAEIEANTNRIVGTYGYMSPEYAMSGVVSMKTDVFSFGVLVLEIVSGKKNYSRYHSDRPLNLVGYAWQLWNDGKGLELIDPILNESISDNQVLRCLHVGLLCVQDQANDRPTMSDVVSMLASDTMLLPSPNKPAFFINVNSDEPEPPEGSSKSCSINNVTISEMAAR